MCLDYECHDNSEYRSGYISKSLITGSLHQTMNNCSRVSWVIYNNDDNPNVNITLRVVKSNWQYAYIFDLPFSWPHQVIFGSKYQPLVGYDNVGSHRMLSLT